MTQRSECPPRFDENAIQRPLGDQAGSRSSAWSVVSCRTALVTTSSTQRSDAQAKAIDRPSGDQLGLASTPFLSSRTEPVSIVSSQRSPRSTKAITSPAGDQAQPIHVAFGRDSRRADALDSPTVQIPVGSPKQSALCGQEAKYAMRKATGFRARYSRATRRGTHRESSHHGAYCRNSGSDPAGFLRCRRCIPRRETRKAG